MRQTPFRTTPEAIRSADRARTGHPVRNHHSGSGSRLNYFLELLVDSQSVCWDDWPNQLLSLPPLETIVALKDCPICKKSVSEEAKMCPHCGHPLKESTAQGMFTSAAFMFFLGVGPILVFVLLAKMTGGFWGLLAN
jgi:hypothetical protein